MTGGLTADEQRTWCALTDMMRLVCREADRQLQRDSGMPVAYYAILRALSEAPDRGLRMTALAEALDGSQSRLSHAVNRLQDRGWVARTRCEEDARCWYAALTTVGRDVLESATPGHAECVREVLFDPLTDKQRHSLRTVAEIVADRLRGRVAAQL
ncbi:MAG: MarR family transcriptional regulator [Candidatus Nanopelagicales bacterium]|nr:MarR family transcriptional regulator [Candidatus Nanopelagicales bacterium]MDZ4248843.1 MarR family transcriptional regulator [Candidatus Nanopelagicales bacterium]